MRPTILLNDLFKNVLQLDNGERRFGSQADLTLDHLATPLVPSSSEIARTFLKDHAREFAKCQREASKEVRGGLEEAILSLRQSGAEGESRAEEIAGLLDLHLPKIKTEEGEEKTSA